MLAEEIAALLEFPVEALEHAQAELPVALDGHRTGMGKLVRRVGLELDALLEVDQVELDFVRAVPEGEIGDQHVQQGGLSGAGLARDQHVLRSTPAETQLL